MTASRFWRERMFGVPACWWDEAADIIRFAEARRVHAKFKTGSISMTCAVALRAIAAWVGVGVYAEVGTFIGVSTLSLAADGATVYTCDISNDCLEKTPRVARFPYTRSTVMFRHMVARGVTARLFFFDGLLTDEDIPLIRRIAAPDAVYVCDDYNGTFKGVKNVEKLQPVLPHYRLLPASGPVGRDTTLAVLLPESRA